MTAPPERMRGLHRIRDPHVWGTVVGAVGGTVFVMANREDLSSPWASIAAALWAGALIGYIWFVFVAPRLFDEALPAAPHAGLIYLGSVAGMLALIRVGTTELRPAIIVVAVGLHFFPFAWAFHMPMFAVLGSVMVVLGVAGLATGAAEAAAVASGIAMIVVITADAARTRRPRLQE